MTLGEIEFRISGHLSRQQLLHFWILGQPLPSVVIALLFYAGSHLGMRCSELIL